MAKLEYKDGDATRPSATGPAVIVHVCNDVGKWGRGFVLALSARWPAPEQQYKAWYAARDQNDFALGAVQFVSVEHQLWVANLVGQHGIRRSGAKPPVRYEAIDTGLRTVGDFAIKHGASVHMPRIGAGLAGGRWDQVEPIILLALVDRGVDVTVYDL